MPPQTASTPQEQVMRSNSHPPSNHGHPGQLRYNAPGRTLKQRPREQRRNKLLALGVGAPTLGFSSLCALGAMINITQNFEAVMLVMLIIASIVSVLSIIAMTLGLKQRATTALIMDQRTERQLLELAAESGGQLNAALLATKTDLNLEESEEALTTLARRQLADMQLRHDGSLTYLFPTLMSAQQLQQEQHLDHHHRREFDQQLNAPRSPETTFDFGASYDGSDGSIEAGHAQHTAAHHTKKK